MSIKILRLAANNSACSVGHVSCLSLAAR